MHMYIELFKARDTWYELSPEERGAYVQRVGASMSGILEAGGEIVGVGTADPGTSHHVGFDFYAVWKLPDAEVVQSFEQGIEDDEWYSYFDQVNAAGELTGFDAVAKLLMEA
jgi:hypothetical protein